MKYRQYSHSALTDAYYSVKENNITVAAASRIYKVPMQTLRDRVLEKIPIDTVTTGRAPILSLEEEAKLVNHLQKVAALGYGYTRQEVVNIASEFAMELKKRSGDKPLTLNWFVKFIARWPELRVIKPRGLDTMRAKSTSKVAVSSYFEELNQIMMKYNLKEKPHLIFNVDEKGVTQDHIPPYIVAGRDYNPVAITSGRSKTTTIIGCGSASGMAIPPFFVFSGKRLMPDLLKGATPGANGTVSETGWSNSEVFKQYLQQHFMKYVPQRQPGEHLLLLMDGHKSHISVGLVEWAKQYNIILFILPAHTSHLLQPMDVGCYGPFQKIYYHECHKLMRETSTTITRYDICRLSCRVYTKALSMENLHAAFKKTGIYPFDETVICSNATTPAEAFVGSVSDDIDDHMNHSGDAVQASSTDSDRTDKDTTCSPSVIFHSKFNKLLMTKRQTKQPRCHIGQIVSGQPITEDRIYNKLTTKSKRNSQECLVKPCATTSASSSKVEKSMCQNSTLKNNNRSTLKFINDDSDPDESSDSEIAENDKCCVCGLFNPWQLRNSVSIIFTKWVKCDGIKCDHWVHLKYCTEVSVIRRGVKFYCPHCPADTEE